MKKTIAIIGAIGTFAYIKDGKKITVNGVQLADVISQIEALPADTNELIIEMGGLGGSVPVAKAMRNYIKSKQPRLQVTTRQVDDLASANTILFTSGSKREAIDPESINPKTGKPYFVMVHNPYTPHFEGDADAMKAEEKELRASEDEFIAIYQEDTGISKEAIAPLMKAETFLDGNKAVALKLATSTYKPLAQAAYHQSTMETQKDTKDLSVLEQILAYVKSIGGKGKIVAVAPPAELKGKPVLIDGKAAVDGVYTVVGGVITMLAEAPTDNSAAPAAAAAGAAPVAKADEAKLEELLALLKKETKSDADIAAEVKKQVDAQVLALKKQIKTDHIPLGFTPEQKTDDVKEWDRSFKANEHAAMRKNDPEKYQRLFYAKYGRMPT